MKNDPSNKKLTYSFFVENTPPNRRNTLYIHIWFMVRLTKRQVTSSPHHLWPDLWIKFGRNAKLKEKQQWSIEKPALDNAGRLRGIYFIDPEDMEFKETIKNARDKLEIAVAP